MRLNFRLIYDGLNFQMESLGATSLTRDDQDDTGVANLYRKAAEQGDASAQFNLAICYRNGTGVNQDDTEAVKWYRKAAEQGHAGAQSKLEKNKKEEVVKIVKESIEQGNDSDAFLKMGLAYYAGYDVEKDQQLARNYFKRAAELGNKKAQFIVNGDEEVIALLKKFEEDNNY